LIKKLVVLCGAPGQARRFFLNLFRGNRFIFLINHPGLLFLVPVCLFVLDDEHTFTDLLFL
jgi:hypothetical protein